MLLQQHCLTKFFLNRSLNVTVFVCRSLEHNRAVNPLFSIGEGGGVPSQFVIFQFG